MNALEARNVTKQYATHKALDSVSITIPEKTIYGLLGPNGAGKTTLIRIINQIINAEAGSIEIFGEPLQEKHVGMIGYLPEERGLYKKMKVGDQLMYLAQLKGLSRPMAYKKIKHWFTKFEMQTWWNKKIEDLSKGMGQKLQFVITVLHEPRLIILDEPFSGLDPVNSNLIKEEIYQLARSGCTIIFSTHRMEQVEEICDQIILVNKGEKILDGTVNQVKQQYKENKFFIGLAKQPNTVVSNAFDVVSHEENNGLMVKIREGYSTNDVLEFFIRQQLPVREFHEILPSLNDIFIRLVEGSAAVTRQFQTVVS